MVDLTKQSIEQISNLDFICSCGRRHKVSIGDIRIGSGVLKELPEVLSQYKGKKILLVADKNTYAVAGHKVEDMLSGEFLLDKLIYQDDHLPPDEKSLGSLLMALENDTSLMLTVGSGTLNDITRYVSAKTNIPFVIVATAPSMDGYASVISAMIRNGVKSTLQGVYPAAIIGDTQIMKDAPMHMMQAGLGDVVGKYTALADWKMSQILGIERDEYYCENISNLVESIVEKCVDAAPQLTSRDEDTTKAIMEGLVLSGLCIALAGHTRPASGSEHQISHYVEMKFIQNNVDTKWLHGNKVGVGTIAILEAYDYLFSKDIEEIRASGKYKNFDKEEWVARIERCYGYMAEEILDIQKDELILDPEERQKRMDLIAEKWDDLKKECYEKLPSADELTRVLKGTGAICSPKELGLDRQMFKDSLMVSKEIRIRYGIMQLLDDLGMLEEAAEYIASKYY